MAEVQSGINVLILVYYASGGEIFSYCALSPSSNISILKNNLIFTCMGILSGWVSVRHLHGRPSVPWK